jgi:hypothetical protein
MSCANCAVNATYVYDVSPSYSLHYCPRHLPAFLKARAKTGELTIPTILKAPSKKKAVEPVEEATIEEPIVEEATDDGAS